MKRHVYFTIQFCVLKCANKNVCSLFIVTLCQLVCYQLNGVLHPYQKLCLFVLNLVPCTAFAGSNLIEEVVSFYLCSSLSYPIIVCLSLIIIVMMDILQTTLYHLDYEINNIPIFNNIYHRQQQQQHYHIETLKERY